MIYAICLIILFLLSQMSLFFDSLYTIGWHCTWLMLFMGRFFNQVYLVLTSLQVVDMETCFNIRNQKNLVYLHFL